VPRLLVRLPHREAGSAGFLMAMALVALVWANAWPESYEALWTTVLTVDVGVVGFSEDVRHWVNDLLIAVFFVRGWRRSAASSSRGRSSAAAPPDCLKASSDPRSA